MAITRASSIWTAAAVALFGAEGCAPSLSTLQPAHVAKPGHVQAHLGFDVSLPTGTIRRAVDVAEPLADAANNRDLTDDEKRRVFDAGVNLAVNPPSPTSNLGIAVGVVKRVEVNGRLAGGGWRLGGRFQILDRDTHGVDLSVGLGASRYTYEFPASGVIPILKIDDFTRWTFDVPILFGISGDFYRVWGGPKLLYSTFDTAVRLDIPFVKTSDLAKFEGSTLHLAGQGGVAIGYKVIFIGIEMTLASMSGSADATILGSASRYGLGSFIIHPSVALLLEI
jgi:hypothetical protein